MTGTRWLVPLVAAAVLVGLAGAGMLDRKPKGAAQVERLAKTLRTDRDEGRRRAAVAELREADPRAVPDIIPALLGALQRDPAAAVRADAAEAIGSFKAVFPVAGAALEAAAEADPAAAVREAAQQALWEYHLNGYRGLKGADGFPGQSPEPPLARRAVKPTPVPVPAEVSPPVTALKPPVVEPRTVAPPPVIYTTAPPLVLDGTPEPPLARRSARPVPPPMGLIPEKPKPVPPPVMGPLPGLPTIPPIPGPVPPK